MMKVTRARWTGLDDPGPVWVPPVPFHFFGPFRNVTFGSVVASVGTGVVYSQVQLTVELVAEAGPFPRWRSVRIRSCPG